MKALLLLTRGGDEGTPSPHQRCDEGTSLSPEVMKALLLTRGGDEGTSSPEEMMKTLLPTLTLTCSYPVIL